MHNESLPPHDGLETTPIETETAKQKFERERLTRRQALKKFGITSAMATFALFSVDDLARMVGVAMERQAKNSKIAEQVAKELQGMGVAMANPVPYYVPSPNCLGCCTGTDPTICQDCCGTKTPFSSDSNSPYGKCLAACDGIG